MDSIGFAGWWSVCGVVAAMWIARCAILFRIRRTQELLSSRSYDGPPSPAPSVSVLVAAKDEESNIESCIRSFLEQDYPDFELIVINDRSSDATEKILFRLEREFENRLSVVTVRSLPSGWAGKNHAMHLGVRRAKGQWLCFADADCRQTSRGTLSMAMREVVEHDVDFLSVLPVLETHTFWERVLQPVCAAILTFWFRPDKVNDPRSSIAYANGAFMLLNRATYLAIGGHENVRTELNEDIQMARLAKQAGRRLKVIANDDLYTTRMYDSLRACWRGWSRIFYGSFKATPGRLWAALGMLSLFSIFPWASMVAAVCGSLLADNPTPYVITAVVCLVIIVLIQAAMTQFYCLARARVRWSAAYILGACVCWGILLNALLKLAGATGTTWRGTTYRRGVETPSPAPPTSTDPAIDVI